MIEEIKKNTDVKMQKSLSLLTQELAKLRTGRASPALLEGIRVEYYGSQLPLNQVATISIPEPRLIIIQPWDKTALPNIEKAIFKSAVGLTPNNDGSVIRLAVPPLTTERREELIKLTLRMAEETKVAIRNIRREANNEIKKLEKSYHKELYAKMEELYADKADLSDRIRILGRIHEKYFADHSMILDKYWNY